MEITHTANLNKSSDRIRMAIVGGWLAVLVVLLATGTTKEPLGFWLLLGATAVIWLAWRGRTHSAGAVKASGNVLTASYDSDKAMRRDMERKIAEGYTVQATNVTEHRGFFLTLIGILSFGLFLLFFPKRKHFHVTYLRATSPGQF